MQVSLKTSVKPENQYAVQLIVLKWIHSLKFMWNMFTYKTLSLFIYVQYMLYRNDALLQPSRQWDLN